MGSFKLEAKTICIGIQKMTGIGESTLDAALKGDLDAADQILKYNEDIVRQAEIADTVITAMKDGMDAHSKLIAAKANFFKSASTTLTSVQKNVSEVKQSDLKLQHSTDENELKDKLETNKLVQSHKRKICLLPQQYRVAEVVADMDDKQSRYLLTQSVNRARTNADNAKKQLTPRQQDLENIRSIAGDVGKAGSGVGGFLGGVFNKLFGA